MSFCLAQPSYNSQLCSPSLSSPSFAVRFGVYVPLCCFHQEGGKSQAAPAECDYPADHQQNELAEAPLFRPRDFFFLLRENLREQFSSPPHMPIHTCPPPTHSHTPELIRTEVEELKSDFNRRIKEVLFNSLFSAYYVAFLPLCFVKVSLLYLGFSFLNGAQLLRWKLKMNREIECRLKTGLLILNSKYLVILF